MTVIGLDLFPFENAMQGTKREAMLLNLESNYSVRGSIRSFNLQVLFGTPSRIAPIVLLIPRSIAARSKRG